MSLHKNSMSLSQKEIFQQIEEWGNRGHNSKV